MFASLKKNQNIFLILVATLISTSVFAESDRSCRKKVICADTVKAKTICADELIVKTGCCASRTITAKDFMDADGNLSQTFVISKPGKYSLGQNIAFAPVDQDAVAIQILANDVHLDLCGNTLTQGNDTFEVFAVQIGEGFAYSNPDNVLKNITITNGNITKFTGSGIFCYNASFDGGAGELPFESLTFTNLNILDCGSHPSFVISGIYLESFASGDLYDPATRVAYKNVIIENCAVNRSLGNVSIYISTGDNVVINSTQANDLSTEVSVFATFAYLLSCRNLQMIDCQGNGARDLDPEATTAQCGGAFLAQSINVYLSNCQFNDSYGEADVIVGGANLSNVQNGIFENVQFNNPRGGEFANTINSVHMSDDALQQTQGNGLKFIDCQFNGARISPANATGPNRVIVGFTGITLRNIEFVNCHACNIITENPNRSALGFSIGTQAQDPIAFFANSRNITFTNCVASDIEAPNSSIGYRLPVGNINRRGTQASLDNIVLENCIAERIHSSSPSVRVAGILEGLSTVQPALSGPFPAQFNLFVKNCRVSDVRAGQGNPLSAGILVESVKRPNLTGNSVSDCDRGVLFTGTNLITPSTLFQLATTQENAETFPPVFIDLTSIPAATPLQSFSNITQGNSIDIAPSPATIELLRNYIISPTDLNTLGWQTGDEIVYNNNGGADIGGLVSTTTYYAIVYVPGYAENGVVIDNTVDNCTVSGFEDAAPTTSSAWVNNFAFNCGVPASADANYDIAWSGTAPVYAGDLADYPTGSAKAFNISLIP